MLSHSFDRGLLLRAYTESPKEVPSLNEKVFFNLFSFKFDLFVIIMVCRQRVLCYFILKAILD